MLKPGEVIEKRWRVLEKIGEGTFSEIYAARDAVLNQRVAVKIESKSLPGLKQVLEWESNIIVKLQHLPHICKHYWFGMFQDKAVLVMELLGESLSQLRQKAQSANGLSPTEVIPVALQMLSCLEDLHRAGYVHRDIKPSNFVRGVGYGPHASDFYLIDFGLTKPFRTASGEIIPPRSKADFRGTSMYASAGAHALREQGPVDDMWSFLFVVVDLLRGELPWSREALNKERDAVLKLKTHYTISSPADLVEGLPGERYLLEIMKELGRGKEYGFMPDYNKIRQLLEAIQSERTENVLQAVSYSAQAAAGIDSRAEPESWAERALKALAAGNLHSLCAVLEEAEKNGGFFLTHTENFDQALKIQEILFQVEKAVHDKKVAPPSIQTFDEQQKHEQQLRADAMRRRREKEEQFKASLYGAQRDKDQGPTTSAAQVDERGEGEKQMRKPS